VSQSEKHEKTKLAYKAGSLHRLGTVPAWYLKAGASDQFDWTESLVKEGAELVEQFGDTGDTFEIFRTPDGGYLIEMHDVHFPIASVFIDEVFDYLRFRIDWLKPLIELSDRADRQAREEIERKREL
jgi:hypothetical protein